MFLDVTLDIDEKTLDIMNLNTEKILLKYKLIN